MLYIRSLPGGQVCDADSIVGTGIVSTSAASFYTASAVLYSAIASLEIIPLFEWPIRQLSVFPEYAIANDFSGNVYVVDGTSEGTVLLYSGGSNGAIKDFVGQIGNRRS